MKQLTFICLFTIVLSMSGCDRGEPTISNMPILDFQIYVSDIDEKIKKIMRLPERVETYYAVNILVSSTLGGCINYDQTRVFSNNMEIDPSNLSTWHDSPVIWRPGDTLRIEVTETDSTDISGFCPEYVYYWYQTIFIGFCVPGEYTTTVNDRKKHLR